MNTSEICVEIIKGKFTAEDLQTIQSAILFARTKLVQSVRRDIVIGDEVKFTHSRNGSVITGKVMKIGRKNAIVNTVTGTKWRVSMSSLTKVDAR